MAELGHHSNIMSPDNNISRLLSKYEVFFEYSVVAVVLGCFALVILTKMMLSSTAKDDFCLKNV